MSSTRNVNFSRQLLASFALAAASVTVSFTTGCQRVQPVQPDTLSDAPLIVDEAMQIRDWDRSTAFYASGAVVAGSDRRRLEPKNDDRWNYALDPAIGLVDIAIIPFTYFREPPFTQVVSRGTIIPPSYTAMPPIEVVE